jgi:polar amino acid transport system substrate-binding protein
MGSVAKMVASALGLLICGSAAAQQDLPTVHLTSLEWPPYTGANIDNEGETTTVVRHALLAMGYRLEVEFFPWKRAVALAQRPSRFAGYFPEYHSDAVARRCLLSDSVGSGAIGFAQPRAQPVKWQTLDDLAAYRIGVVQGYVNSAEFDLRVAQQKQSVDVARDDTQNLRKLAAGRIALAVVDQRVFDFLMQNDPQLQPYQHQLTFNARPLEIKHLFICFRPTAEGLQLRSLVNAGLRKIQAGGVRPDR